MKKISSLRDAISVKTLLLAQGVKVGEFNSSFKPVKPSLYSYEMTPESRNKSIPQEIILYSNREYNIRIFSTIRANNNSPISLENENGKVFLRYLNEEYYVEVPNYPNFYDCIINGESSGKYFQKLGGDTIALVMLNYCEYYSRKLQCKFCEIHENFTQEKSEIIMAKSPEKISQHLCNAIALDDSIRQIIINSGNYTKDNNRTYKQIIKTLQLTISSLPTERLNKIAFLVIAAPPEDLALLSELKKAGATSVYINMEVWSNKQMMSIVPGKHEYGRDNYFRCFDIALKSFGKGYVYTNLIYGIQSIDLESNKKFDQEEEIDILTGAMDTLISKEVILTNTIYHYSGKNKIGSIPLPPSGIEKFHMIYGKKIFESGLVSELCNSKQAVYASIEAIPNSLNNEPFVYHKYLNQRVEL
jgi:hypothetical protein